ncbi:MAG: hypothetical protein GY699_10365, partial [Desulfobacteraceae bacterium]|nr:hypothetical protein [Desulfobacteraceae bacterium]
MPISIPEQVNGKSIISAKDDTLFLVGEIDQMDPGAFMTPIFETVKEQMDQMVKIDLTKLEYLNSSG